MAAGSLVHTILQSTQAIDFGAMVAGVISAEVTIVGAEVGDAVVANKIGNDVLTDDVTLEAWVEAADTVTVVLVSNDATATTNFASVNVNVLVFK